MVSWVSGKRKGQRGEAVPMFFFFYKSYGFNMVLIDSLKSHGYVLVFEKGYIERWGQQIHSNIFCMFWFG